MGPTIIARNYAETLFALAEKHGGQATMQEYARALDEVSDLLRREPRIRQFIETPRIDVEAKKEALNSTLAGRVPELFLRFLLVVVDKRRQGLLQQIAAEYHSLLDESFGRVRADITLAEEPDPALQREIVSTLEDRLKKTVVPKFYVDPDMIGGVVVRVGDQILDGSVRRRIAALRRRLLEVELPAAPVA